MPKKRKTNRDHAKRQQRPMMEDEEIAAQLEQLVTPAVVVQEKYYRQLGMRDRILNLPLMVSSADTNLVGRSWSQRTQQNTRQRRISMVRMVDLCRMHLRFAGYFVDCSEVFQRF